MIAKLVSIPVGLRVFAMDAWNLIRPRLPRDIAGVNVDSAHFAFDVGDVEVHKRRIKAVFEAPAVPDPAGSLSAAWNKALAQTDARIAAGDQKPGRTYKFPAGDAPHVRMPATGSFCEVIAAPQPAERA